MGKAIDITGQRFGRLTALKPTDERSTRSEVIWLCQCDCGNMTKVRSGKLRSGNTKSCGCLARELSAKMAVELRTKDISNKRFGRLIAINDTGEKNGNNHMWRCICDCGNEVVTVATNLIRGRTKSCGCIQREKVRELGLSNKGENNPAYNQELTDEQRGTNKFHRTSTTAKECRIATYTRDNFRCTACNNTSRRLIAHHLDSFADNKDKRFELDNLITMCNECHIEFHKAYSYGKNTRQQYKEFQQRQKDKPE